MFGKKLFGNILSIILVILVIITLISAIFSYVGLIVLSIFLAIGVGIAAIYSLIVYIKSFVAAARELGSCGNHSLISLLKHWIKLVFLASKYAFKQNLSVASNALAKSGQYRLLSPRRWMWFIVAPAAVIFGTAVILGVFVLHIIIFLIVAQIIFYALLAYLAIAFLFACGYAVFYSVRNTKKEYFGDMFAFDFTRTVEFSHFSYAIKQYFIGLWTSISNIFNENLEIGKNNKNYAINYKIYQPQYVFLISSLVALPLIAVLWGIVLSAVAIICFIPIVISNLIWLAVSKLINLKH